MTTNSYYYPEEPPAETRFLTVTLAELRRRLPDYLATLGVELRSNGTRLVGLCPNHADHLPSFAVFGTHHQNCGFTGDVFAVSEWMGRESTFPESVADVSAALEFNWEGTE